MRPRINLYCWVLNDMTLKWYFINNKNKKLKKEPLKPACEKSFKFTIAMKRHVRAFHLKERKFKCKICPKAYTDPTPLRHHINASHGDGSTFYDCIQCKKKFTTKRRFLEHNDKYHKETIEERKPEADQWAFACPI